MLLKVSTSVNSLTLIYDLQLMFKKKIVFHIIATCLFLYDYKNNILDRNILPILMFLYF